MKQTYSMRSSVNTTTNNSLPHAIAQVLIPNHVDSLPVILPMVASLTHLTSERWVTWITHRQPTKAMLEAHGANTQHLRIVYVKPDSDVRWIVWQALAQQNSHTVIAEQAVWKQEDIDTFEAVAANTESRGIMIGSQGK